MSTSKPTSTKPNRRNILGIAAIAFASATLGNVIPAMAQQDLPQDRLSLVGTWEIIVEFPDGTKNPTLILFNENGSVVETNALTKATGLGEWEHVEGRKFDYVFWEQFFDKDNVLINNIRVHHALTVSADGLTYSAEGDGKIFDLKGEQVGEVATTIEGRRLN